MYLANHSTERLFIRPITEADADTWKPFFMENDGLQFVDLFPEKSIEEKTKLWLGWQLKRYQESRYGLLGLVEKETQKLVGMCGLLTQEIENQTEIEIGYHVLPQYWGNGFATEAAQFFKDYAWQNNLTNSLISIIHVDNIRSQKVAEKNGMVQDLKTQFHNKPVYIYRIFKPVS